MRNLLRDFSFGLRLYRRNPGFSALGVLILALGIGATAAIFSLIDGILLNPLPYRDPGRLAVVWSDFGKFGGSRHAFTSPADYFDWRDRNRSFESMAAYFNTNRTFTGLDQPLTPLAHEVTANFFDVLGVRAFRGRTFLPGEDRPGRDRVAVISHSLWQSLFAGSEAAIGKPVELDGTNSILVGVLPPGFRVPNNAITAQPDLWVPASFESQRQERLSRSLVVFGRLRPGVSDGTARAEMVTLAQQIARENPASTNAPDAAVQLIRDDLTNDFRGLFLLLL
ncbi:MAG TPA: ABC transporter permease, partial [Bryobacteraceae bacterium]